jgi:hypothetical protein
VVAPPRTGGLLAALLAAGLGLGATPADDVALGLRHYERLEYDRAVVVLGRALTDAELSPTQRATALEVLAFSYVVLDDAVHATESFHRLLDRDPGYRVDERRSPRLRDAFLAALESWTEGRKIAFEPDADTDLTSGRLIGGDPARVGAVETLDDEGRRRVLSCERRSCRGDRPGIPFRVRVLDAREQVLFETARLEGAPSGPPAWLWWVAIGVGVVAAGTTIAVVAGSSGAPPDGSLGTLMLP